jgi:membrane associated rhomboid family serine protease
MHHSLQILRLQSQLKGRSIINWYIVSISVIFLLQNCIPNLGEFLLLEKPINSNLLGSIYLTLFTTCFIHINLTHFLMNLFGIIVFIIKGGYVIERELGKFRFILITIGFGVISNYLFFTFIQEVDQGLMGFSGVIYALFGLLFSFGFMDLFSLNIFISFDIGPLFIKYVLQQDIYVASEVHLFCLLGVVLLNQINIIPGTHLITKHLKLKEKK